MEKPTINEEFNDDGTHSHWSLINSEDGVKLWSEEPDECKAKGYPIKDHLDKEVLGMAKIMQCKIEKNKHKDYEVMNPHGVGRSWKHCDIKWLLLRLREEVDELEKAINENAYSLEIAKECADVCNFSMMIADNLNTLNK